MRYIKSCGFIVYKAENNENFYLIIKSHNGDVGFPKGHMEPGENELQTAIRELKEETGFTTEDLEFLISIKTTVAFCNENIDIYVARNLKPGNQNRDEG